MSSSPRDISDMRQPYCDIQQRICETQFHKKTPYTLFEEWFDEACSSDKIFEANAMTVSTVNAKGRPSSRMILLKGFEKEGFKFYTNFVSRKSQDLDENPQACILFYWDALKKSVRIEGVVSKLSDSESSDYFHRRPRNSQISATVSRQSSVIPSREILDEDFKKAEEKFRDISVIPKPETWGGYILKPDYWEFWQGQTSRLHDRVCYKVTDEDTSLDGWKCERLAP